MQDRIDAILDAKQYPATPEQRHLVETVVNSLAAPRSNRKVIVAASVAGSGKTATSLDVYNVIHEAVKASFQWVAFNVDAKKEMISRGVSNRHARTLNGLGHANLSYFARQRGLTLVLEDERGINKTSSLLKKLNSDLFQVAAVRRFAKSLVGFCKSEALLRPSDQKLADLASHYEVIIDLTEEELEELDESLDSLESQAFQWVREVLAYGSEIPSSGEWLIDFNDQVFLPVVHKMNCYQNDLLVVDEAQDLSICDKRLIDRCLKSNGVLVLVGDDYQCIYAWRGCRVDSLKATLSNDKLDVVSCPLTYNFRSCEEIIAEAQKDCPHIQCGTGRHGFVEHLPIEDFDVTELSGDVAVLSRTRAPLIDYAIECLKADTPFTFRFSLKFLIDFVNQVSNNHSLQIRSFRRRLNKWVADRREQYELQDAEQALADLDDNVAILETILEKVTLASTVGHLIEDIERLDREIANAEGALKLSTMHGSKGLEWDTTYLLGFEDIGMNCHREWKKIEARNLRLVARTRAKNRMVYLEKAE